jgi:hypothetical protein
MLFFFERSLGTKFFFEISLGTKFFFERSLGNKACHANSVMSSLYGITLLPPH